MEENGLHRDSYMDAISTIVIHHSPGFSNPPQLGGKSGLKPIDIHMPTRLGQPKVFPKVHFPEPDHWCHRSMQLPSQLAGVDDDAFSRLRNCGAVDRSDQNERQLKRRLVCF
jgi:hypothetical protein